MNGLRPRPAAPFQASDSRFRLKLRRGRMHSVASQLFQGCAVKAVRATPMSGCHNFAHQAMSAAKIQIALPDQAICQFSGGGKTFRGASEHRFPVGNGMGNQQPHENEHFSGIL